MVHFRLSKGTLVPVYGLTQAVEEPTSTRPRPAAASTAHKRGRDDAPSCDDPGGDPALAEGSVPPPWSLSGPAVSEVPMARAHGPQVATLLELQERLNAQINALIGEEATVDAAEHVSVGEPQAQAAPPSRAKIEPIPPVPPVLPLAGGEGARLSAEQRHSLETLRQSLQDTTALLRNGVAGASHAGQGARHGSMTAGEAGAESVVSNFWSWMSNPPSPPTTTPPSSGRKDAPPAPCPTADRTAVPWSSGLCSCLDDLTSCMCGFCCWPIIAGQLSQKILRSRGLCLCLALPMVALMIGAWAARAVWVAGVAEYSANDADAGGAANATTTAVAQPSSMVMSQSQTGALTPSIAERPVRLGGQECDQIDQLLIIVFSFFCGACFMWLVLVRTIVRQREMDSPAARSTTAASPILVLELWALPTCATRRAGHGQLWRRALSHRREACQLRRTHWHPPHMI